MAVLVGAEDGVKKNQGPDLYLTENSGSIQRIDVKGRRQIKW